MNDTFAQGKIWDIIASIHRLILLICNILSTLFVVANVILRYLFKMDFLGFEEVMCVVILWMYFIGASYGSYEKSHISADMLGSALKSIKSKSIHSIVIGAIDTAVLLVFCYWSIEYFIWNLNNPMVSASLKIPLITSQFAVTLGIFMMLVFSVYYLLREIRNGILVLRKPED